MIRRPTRAEIEARIAEHEAWMAAVLRRRDAHARHRALYVGGMAVLPFAAALAFVTGLRTGALAVVAGALTAALAKHRFDARANGYDETLRRLQKETERLRDFDA